MIFTDLDLDDDVLDGLEAMNFQEAMPIQAACIPPIMQGKDLLGCAQTGSGKTAAYILPIIDKISRGELPNNKINAIIMAPTRELVKQIEQQVEGFSYYVSLSSLAIYGGTGGIEFAQQQNAMEQGTDIIIATPGRLISMLALSSCDLSGVSYFVLDEADKMLDMGFYPDIQAIYKQLPSTCQVVMFSATMPPKIKELSKQILTDPEVVELEISRPPKTILQSAYYCYDRQKLPIVERLLSSTSSEGKPFRSLVFASSKLQVQTLYRQLSKMNLSVGTIHSDLDQVEREKVMKEFRNGTIQILVATDIVSRGIDIDNIEVVINYELPRDFEDYVHRIGRTARGNNGSGVAITLINELQWNDFAKLQHFLQQEIHCLPIDPDLGQAPAPKNVELGDAGKPRGGRHYRGKRKPFHKDSARENRGSESSPNQARRRRPQKKGKYNKNSTTAE